MGGLGDSQQKTVKEKSAIFLVEWSRSFDEKFVRI